MTRLRSNLHGIRHSRLLAIGLILQFLAPAVLRGAETATPVELFVATTGSDQNPGTLDRPFATLEAARGAIRALKGAGPLPAGGVTVWLRAGTYPISRTFLLEGQDSGTANAPITYSNYKDELVSLSGGREIGNFTKVTDPSVLRRIPEPARSKVLQTDLKAQGIVDFGELKAAAIDRPIEPDALELYFQGKPMTLARWPNHDWARIAGVPAGANGGMFAYDGDRPKNWTQADDIWLHGFWTWDWADSYEKVDSIDLSNRIIRTRPPHGVYGYTAGKRYYALNLLEELDEPGEWYLERQTGLLYFWPPAPITRGKSVVSMLEDPLVVLRDASYVTLRGITLEFTRGSAVQIVGGTNNLVANCAFREIGDIAVCIGSEIASPDKHIYDNPLLDGHGGTSNGVVGCEMYDIGQGAIVLGGGDRVTLTPAGNFAVNNDIRDFSRTLATYRPAIWIYGVGNRAAHNLIYDAPHSAIILNGNDHVIEFNEIHDVCLESVDSGSIYMGRDFTERGNVIRYNFFHDLPDRSMISAVYLDDSASGATVFGNIFYNVPTGVLVGGGRDNRIENNIFDSCVQWGIVIQVRGFWQVMLEQPPYSVRYPELAGLTNSDLFVPADNRIERNICYKCANCWLVPPNVTGTVTNNLTGQDPGMAETGKSRFLLRASSPAFKLGFEQIPAGRIGPGR